MTNHQLIVNPLFVIINLAGLAYLSIEPLSETLLPIWRAGKSSTNRQLIPLNRKPGRQIYRQSIDKTQESIDGEEDNAPE